MHSDAEVSVGIRDVDEHRLGLDLVGKPGCDSSGQDVDVPLETDV